MSDLRMPDLNQVLIAGRLTRDPELRYTGSGMAVCRLSVANTRYFRKKDGGKGEETDYIDATVWDKTAEWVGERLKKGRPLLIEGRLKTDQWEDKDSGQKRSKIEINAKRITPLDWDDTDRPAQRENAPKPRAIEEPIPEDDIPF